MEADLKKTISNIEDGKQLVRSSGSVGANYIEGNEKLGDKDIEEQDKYDVCASFEKTAVAHIMQKLKKLFKQKAPSNFAISPSPHQ